MRLCRSKFHGVAVSLDKAIAVPSPKVLATDPALERSVRCCVLDRAHVDGDDGLLSNVHRVFAAAKPRSPDQWTFGGAPLAGVRRAGLRKAVDDGLHSNSYYVLAHDDLGTAKAASSSKRRGDPGGGAADVGSPSLLFELTVTIPRSFFDGRLRDAQDDKRKAKKKKKADLGSDYESDSDSAYGSSDDDGKKKKKGKKGKRDAKKKQKKDDSDDDSDDESPERKKKAKKKRRGADSDADSDEVYSDKESDDDDDDDASSSDDARRKKKKKKKKKKSREKEEAKPSWFSQSMGGARGAAAKAKSTRKSKDDSDDEAGGSRRSRRGAAEGVVEVSCGWALVPLERLRGATGVVTLDLKGGSPFHEEAISLDDVPRGAGGLFASGGRRASRLSIRVGPVPASFGFLEERGCPFPETCLVAAPLAPLVSTYHRYLQDYLGRHVFQGSSAHVADPVLALFRKLIGLEPSRLALRALWTHRYEAALKKLKAPACDLSRERAAQAALQQAVCELWPLCEAYHADNHPDDHSTPALADQATVLATPHPALAHASQRGADRASVVADAERLLAPFLRDEDGLADPDARKRRKDDALFAPFHVRELVPM